MDDDMEGVELNSQESEILDVAENQQTESSNINTLDDVLLQLGRPGLYHILVYMLLWSFNGFIAFNHIALPATMSITPDFKCAHPNNIQHQHQQANNNATQQVYSLQQCYYYIGNTSERKIPCTEWHYEKVAGYYVETIVTKWNLVCDKSFYSSISTTVYFLGVMLGGVSLGEVSDRYGRRLVLLVCMALSVLLLASSVLVSNFVVFTILRFLGGITACGVHSAVYVTAMEITPNRYNNINSITLILTFLSSTALGSLLCWATKSYVKAQLYLTLPYIPIIIISYFFLPDSFRWLQLHGKTKQLNSYMNIAAKINRVKLSGLDDYLVTTSSMNAGKRQQSACARCCTNLLNVFTKWKEIRKRLLAVCFVWTSSGIAYYGLSFNLHAISSDPYLTITFATLIDIIPVIISYFILNRLQKRRTILLYCTLGGVFCIIFTFKHHIFLLMLGKMFAAVTFGLTYVWSSDLFPTIIRNSMVGTCVTVSRTGSVLAPLIVLMGRHTSKDIPVLISGIVLLCAVVIVYFMPQVKRKDDIPNTIEDVEKQQMNDKLSIEKNNSNNNDNEGEEDEETRKINLL